MPARFWKTDRSGVRPSREVQPASKRDWYRGRHIIFLLVCLGHAAAVSATLISPSASERPVQGLLRARIVAGTSKSAETSKAAEQPPKPLPTGRRSKTTTNKSTLAHAPKSVSSETAESSVQAVSENAPSDDVGETIEPRYGADYLDNPAPGYPPLSRRLREEGQVILKVFVEKNGSPSEVNVHSSSGSERLDQAALEAVRRWKFVPARRGEEAVAAWVLVPISFQLRG